MPTLIKFLQAECELNIVMVFLYISFLFLLYFNVDPVKHAVFCWFEGESFFLFSWLTESTVEEAKFATLKTHFQIKFILHYSIQVSI